MQSPTVEFICISVINKNVNMLLIFIINHFVEKKINLNGEEKL